MKVIVPCAGKSSRFPNMRPKWMLNTPNGNLMVAEALKGLHYNNDDIILTILKEHEEKYGIISGLEKAFGKLPTICLLDEQTASQSETVYKTLVKCRVDEPFVVKDSDNYFELTSIEEDYNYISVEDLEHIGEINAANKSYVCLDTLGNVTSIREKQIVSNLFSVGGYYFCDPDDFKSTFVRLDSLKKSELYISVIIEDMISRGINFKTKVVSNYMDWGTVQDWNKYKSQFKTYFIDIDGVIFKNSAQYFAPYWGETEPLTHNVELIKKLKANGNQIILTTSRTEEFRLKTEQDLSDIGLRFDLLIMDCMHAQRIIINDFSKSNPYPSAVAINVKRDADDLDEFIL